MKDVEFRIKKLKAYFAHQNESPTYIPFDRAYYIRNHLHTISTQYIPLMLSIDDMHIKIFLLTGRNVS